MSYPAYRHSTMQSEDWGEMNGEFVCRYEQIRSIFVIRVVGTVQVHTGTVYIATIVVAVVAVVIAVVVVVVNNIAVCC